ncbi:hypothetical protein LAZ67_X004253 [Cordylochernes scorpioides]|uniref:Mos1 transposase HTH domain-containing protein n=1 Tax=Cordylochernes scorpioides TaxID=51811 RepID=A0ABY6LVU0_9ARAC|nr:hypothetical protein LAZ67_X004253 [Cordylochernes scorpioides]
MLTVAYGEATLDRSNVYRWYKMFSEGREDVNDEERAGRPSTSTTDEKINEVEKMILANRRIAVREVAEDLNISIGSCHSIFINDLSMRRVAAKVPKLVPKLLNYDQKQHRMNIANEMLDSVRNDPNLLQRVITGDEAWVYGYDVETKAQSSQWKLPHEPRPKKARQVRLKEHKNCTRGKLPHMWSQVVAVNLAQACRAGQSNGTERSHKSAELTLSAAMARTFEFSTDIGRKETSKYCLQIYCLVVSLADDIISLVKIIVISKSRMLDSRMWWRVLIGCETGSRITTPCQSQDSPQRRRCPYERYDDDVAI